MIPIPEKMVLNKFKKVHIPKVKDLFARYGARYSPVAPPDDAIVLSQPNRKVDPLQEVSNELYRQYAVEQNRRDKEASQTLEANKVSDEA